MSDRAKVASIEAVESFRTTMLLYIEKASVALDEISEEVRRTKDWLDGDRRAYWQREVLRRAKALEQCQQELFSARLSSVTEATQLQHMAVQKARRALQEAEDRLRLIRRWGRQYESRVHPLAREIEKLRHVLGEEMRKAALVLGETVKTLAAYAEARPPRATTASGVPTPAADETPGPGGNLEATP